MAVEASRRAARLVKRLSGGEEPPAPGVPFWGAPARPAAFRGSRRISCFQATTLWLFMLSISQFKRKNIQYSRHSQVFRCPAEGNSDETSSRGRAEGSPRSREAKEQNRDR